MPPPITMAIAISVHAPHHDFSPPRRPIAPIRDLTADPEVYWLGHKSVTGVAEDVRSLCELLPGSPYVEEVVSQTPTPLVTRNPHTTHATHAPHATSPFHRHRSIQRVNGRRWSLAR